MDRRHETWHVVLSDGTRWPVGVETHYAPEHGSRRYWAEACCESVSNIAGGQGASEESHEAASRQAVRWVVVHLLQHDYDVRRIEAPDEAAEIAESLVAVVKEREEIAFLVEGTADEIEQGLGRWWRPMGEGDDGKKVATLVAEDVGYLRYLTRLLRERKVPVHD